MADNKMKWLINQHLNVLKKINKIIQPDLFLRLQITQYPFIYIIRLSDSYFE